MERKANLKPRIGLYTMGLRTYWGQFAGLEERMKHYGAFIAEKLTAMGAEVVRYDLVDTEDTGLAAGENDTAKALFLHDGHYCLSSEESALNVHREVGIPNFRGDILSGHGFVHACVVCENVDAAELGFYFVYCGQDGILIGNIHGKRIAFGTGFHAKRLGFFKINTGTIGGDNRGTLLCKGNANGLSKTCSGTGNDCDSSSQFKHFESSSISE